MAKLSGLGSFGMRAPLRRWCVRLVVSMIGAVACTSSPSPTATSSEPVAASSAAGASAGGSAGVREKEKVPRPIDSESGKSPKDDCDAAVDGYLARRKALDHCERDSDCAEIWPGLCPHGPYYIHREAEVEAVWAIERRIEEHCEVPKCEPPMKLGIAHCDAGRCRPGREPPPTDEKESCWDYRETHLEAGGTAQAQTTSAIRGVTPQLVIAPAHAGRLRL